MAVYSGRFGDGKVVVDGTPPPDGTEAEVFVNDEASFTLTPDMEAELEAAIERLDRGEFVTWEVLRERLRDIEREGSHASN